MAASNDEATRLDTTALTDVNKTTANAGLQEGALPDQENSLDFNPLPVKSKDSAPEVEKPTDTQELDDSQAPADVKQRTLGSPFPSPKLVAKDSKSVASLEEGEIVEGKPDNSVAVSTVLVQEQQEQFDEKAASELASTTAKQEAPEASNSGVRIEAKTDVDVETEDSDFKTDTDATVEAPKSSKPAHSLPPHLRPDFQSPPSRSHGLQDSRHMMPPNDVNRFNDSPRGPRSHFNTYQPRGDLADREHSTRMNAQLMKHKHELNTERTKNLRLRQTIEAEQQQKVEAASSIMLTNLLREQASALTLKANIEARERDLDHREQKISQLELYLSEGQKQLMYALEQNGDRPMSAVQMEHARREAELTAQKAFADLNGKLNIKLEALRLRESAQQTREQQYKAVVRESLQAEFAATSITHEKAEEIADIEYNNGFGAGKDVGRKEAVKESHQRGFLEGYGACHRTQVTLSKVRQGLIARDSAELDFLYDAGHPYNMWNVGERFGRLGQEDRVLMMREEVGVEKKMDMLDRKDGVREEETVVDDKIKVNGGTNGANGVNGTTTPPIHKPSSTSPISKMPPPRPTFAAELRGPSLTHNGHVVLANNAASPVAEETGRPIIKYEDEGVNLIDLM